MNTRKNNGFVGIDMVVAVLAIIIFSGLIISLMYNNALENTKLKRETLATVYLTEIFENIGIATYDEVTSENINSLIPAEIEEKGYTISVEVSSDLENLSNDKQEDIIKKVTATISYKIADKEYVQSMERIKIKK